MLIIRVTHEEYDRLKSACTAQGGRTISDFMRTYILAAVGPESASTVIQKRLDGIDEKLTDLGVLVKRLSDSSS